MRPLTVIHVVPEVTPFSESGGLGLVAGSLPPALQALGLLASVAPLGQELRDWMREAAQKLDAPGRAKRREIISIDEALEMASVTL